MIKLKIKYGNSQTDLRFPCTEKEMSAALERIHAEDVTPLELYCLAPYCRVSSDSTDQLHSFAAQIRYYSDYAKKHPEYQLVDIYADEAVIIGLKTLRLKKC